MMTVLPTLALVLALVQQTADAGGAPDAAAAVDDVLQRAVRFQRGDEPRSRPTSFHGRFYVTVRNREGETFNADIERYYTRSPQRMVTTRVDSTLDTDSTVGWDEGVAWFRDNKSGRVIVYSEDPERFDVDLEQLDFQLLITPLILEAAVLDSLLPRLQDVRLGRPASHLDADDERHVVDVIEARIVDELFPPDPAAPPPLPGEPPPMLDLTLSIDRETGALWALTLERPAPESRRIAFTFDFHAYTPDGLRVPGNIAVYEGGSHAPSVVLGLDSVIDDESDELFVLFDVDVPIDVERFAVPDEG